MKFICYTLMTLLMFVASSTTMARDIYTKNGYPIESELLRFETTDAGPMLWVRDFSSKLSKPIIVDMKVQMLTPWKDSHLAIVVGDLYSSLERSDAGVAKPGGADGEGFIIGDSSAMPPGVTCGPNPTNLQFQSFYTNTVLDGLSCVVVDVGRVYRIVFTVTPDHKSTYQLWDVASGLQLLSRARSWTATHPLHNRGLFVIPLTSTAQYKLLSLQVIQ